MSQHRSRIKSVLYLNKYDTLYFICYIILMKPYYAGRIAGLSQIWDLLIFAVCGIALLTYIIRLVTEGFHSSLDKYILIYVIYMMVNSFLKGFRSNDNITALLIQTGAMMLTVDGLKRRRQEIVVVINCSMMVLVLINLASMILYPKGMVVSQNMYNLDVHYWFLGNRNPVCRFIISAMGLNCFLTLLTEKRLTIRNYIFIMICVVSVGFLKSATVILGMTFVLVFLFLPESIAKKHIFNVFIVYVSCLVLSFAFMFFQAQTKFAGLITSLGRDLTISGRTKIWARATAGAIQNIVWGYGLADSSGYYLLYGASHTHNFYLQTVFNGGVVGLFLMSVIFYRLSRSLLKSMDYKNVRVSFALIAAYCIIGIAEALTQMPMFFSFLVLFDRIAKMQSNRFYNSFGTKKDHRRGFSFSVKL